MPLVGLIYEGQKYDLESPSVPFPRSLLQAAIEDSRIYDVLHVTDLLIGTRELYLRKITPYYEPLDSIVHRFAGSGIHKVMENVNPDSEVKVEWEGIIGKFDALDWINGEISLIDYKHVGSFAVRKALGLLNFNAQIKDPGGNLTFYKSGKKKGQAKTRKEWYIDEKAVDLWPYDYQLNIYRLFYLRAETPEDTPTTINGDVLPMYIAFFVRDGGTIAGSMNGVTDRFYLVKVPYMSAMFLKQFINQKKAAYKSAITNTTPPECDERESWEGWKCQDICPVRETCKAMGNRWLDEHNSI